MSDPSADAPSSGYGGPSAPAPGARFERVNYGAMKDIAVWLTGPTLPADGPAPRTERLRVGKLFDRDLVLLAPGRTRLEIANDRTAAVTVFCFGDRDGFELDIAPGQTRDAVLREPGSYELLCDQDPSLRVRVVVASSSWTATVRSGGWAVFDALPPGSYALTVAAPRLPPWERTVTVTPGGRETVEATATVGRLGGLKRRP